MEDDTDIEPLPKVPPKRILGDFLVERFTPKETFVKVLEKITEVPERTLIYVLNGQIKGIITLSDITSFLFG